MSDPSLLQGLSRLRMDLGEILEISFSGNYFLVSRQWNWNWRMMHLPISRTHRCVDWCLVNRCVMDWGMFWGFHDWFRKSLGHGGASVGRPGRGGGAGGGVSPSVAGLSFFVSLIISFPST